MEPQRLCWERQSQALQGGTNRPEMLFKSLCSLGISLHFPIPWPGISFGGVATQTFSFWRKMTVFVIRLSARGTLNWSGFGDRVSENSQLPISSVLYCEKFPLYEYTFYSWNGGSFSWFLVLLGKLPTDLFSGMAHLPGDMVRAEWGSSSSAFDSPSLWPSSGGCSHSPPTVESASKIPG